MLFLYRYINEYNLLKLNYRYLWTLMNSISTDELQLQETSNMRTSAMQCSHSLAWHASSTIADYYVFELDWILLD